MAAARSSKNQWRAFLFTLVEEGDIDVLSPRDAMTQLTKQFGADVHSRCSGRYYCGRCTYGMYYTIQYNYAQY